MNAVARIRRVLHSPRMSGSLLAGTAVLGIAVIFSLVGPLLIQAQDAEVGTASPKTPPSWEHWLGSDVHGRDVFTTLVLGTPQTLKIGLIAGAVGTGVGLVLGLLAGYFGGLVDGVIRVISDALLTVPAIAILIIIAANVSQMSVELMGVVVAALAWMWPTRTIRSQLLSIRERAYVEVARANGQGELEILFREVMPNLLPYVAASFVAAVGSGILAAIGLEALGLGANHTFTLGTSIYWSQKFTAVLRGMWWWWAPPIGMIAVIFIGLMLLSAGLDRVANPATAKAHVTGAADIPREVLRVAGLTVEYDTPEGPVKAVNDVSFALHAGERMALVGESGSGKTTLATALLSLTKPPGRVVGGQIHLGGRDITKLSDGEMRAVRLSQIALVPQGAMNALNPVMRIREQILDGIAAHEGRQSRRSAADRVDSLLHSVGLHPEVAAHYPHELSGGMKQRVAVAIATALQPKVIVADEPTSALDVVVQRQIVETLIAVQERIGAAVILIGHDMGLVAQFADRVSLMYAGRLIEAGNVDEMFYSPRHPYTRMLIDTLPSLESKEEFVGIPGLPPELLNLQPGCAFRPRCPHAFERCAVETPARQSVGQDRWAACHLYPEHASLPQAPAAEKGTE